MFLFTIVIHSKRKSGIYIRREGQWAKLFREENLTIVIANIRGGYEVMRFVFVMNTSSYE